MTEPALREAIARIDAVASRRGAELRVTVGEPARGADLHACEAVFENPLPPSYRRFLQRHDGLSLKIFSEADRDRPPELVEPAHELTIYGTAEAADATREVRNFFRRASGIVSRPPCRSRRRSTSSSSGVWISCLRTSWGSGIGTGSRTRTVPGERWG